MIKIKARYLRGGRNISENDVENIVIKNEGIAKIIDRVNVRLLGEDEIE